MNLTHAALAQPGPCQYCCHFDRCASDKLACMDFQRYSNFKPIRYADVERYPNALVYKRVFTSKETEEFTNGGMC